MAWVTRPAWIVAGTVGALVVVTSTASGAAAAGNAAVNITGANVPGGLGARIDVSTGYRCNLLSGATELWVQAFEPDTGAQGRRHGTVPVCDGGAQTIAVPVTSFVFGRFHTGKQVVIKVSLLDGEMRVVEEATQTKSLVAGR